MELNWKKVDAKLMKVTPTVAKKWLEKNTNNRKVSIPAVQSLSRALERGDWKIDGAAIRFDRNGFLIDGQHRLTAILETGKSIETFVVTGLDPKAFTTIDQGKKRTVGDVLGIQGEKNSTLLASVLRFIHSYRKQNIHYRLKIGPTHAELNTILREYPSLKNHIDERDKGLYPLGVSPTNSIFASWLLTSYEPTYAKDFFEKLRSGENLPKGHPVLVLRNLLQRKKGAAEQTPSFHILALIFKAWTKFIRGANVKRFSFDSDREAFPYFPLPEPEVSEEIKRVHYL